MRTVALINSASGSVGPGGADDLTAALAAAGVRQAEIVELDPPACAEQMVDLAARDVDLVVVWGGDGTLRTALATFADKTPNLLLLPGGTMNILSRSLHGDGDWREVLARTLAGPKRTRIDAGRANGEPFYVALMAGAPARFAEARESLRRGEVGRVLTEARTALEALSAGRLSARVREAFSFAGEELPSTSVLAALVGPMARGADFEVVTLEEASPMAALKALWSSVRDDWRNAPGVRTIPALSLVIESEDEEPIPVIVDGEALDLGPRVEVQLQKDAAQCLIAG
jgi:diacylglycerol kinase family enzyme